MFLVRSRVAVCSLFAALFAFPVAASAAAGTFQMSASSYGAVQSLGVKITTVDRVGGSSGAVSVTCTTVNNSATAGRDYTAVTRTLSWANGDATPKNCDIPITNQAGFSGQRHFFVAISSPSSGATLGSLTQSTVIIYGSGINGVSEVSLSSASYSVTQGAGALTVTVNRSGVADAANVAYATSNSSAVAGTDYTAESGELVWNVGDASSRTFTIPISNAKPFSGSKTFAVAIASPSGVGMATSTAVVSISGDAASAPHVGTATLTWSAPTTVETGGVLTNLAGYQVSYGTSSTTLNRVVQIANPKTLEFEVQALGPGTWYFAVSAYTTTGVVSPLSNLVSKTI